MIFRLLPVLLMACGRSGGSPQPTETMNPVFWSDDDPRPLLEHGFFAEAGLPELSMWATHLQGSDRPNHAGRGPFAVGNGAAFAFLGLADPANTLHSLAGPTYSRKDRFFGDIYHMLEVDGSEVDFTEEWVARPRGTAIAITRADANGHTLYTVDFAPLRAQFAPSTVQPAIVRIFLVESEAGGDIAITQHSAQPAARSDVLTETTGERVLAYVPWNEVDTGTTEVRIDFGTVPPGGSGLAALILATGVDKAAALAVADEIMLETLETRLAQTVEAWLDHSLTGVQLSTSDPLIADLYEGLRVAIEVQTGAYGGVSPMSRYSEVWLRDTIGPTRFLTRAGVPEAAAEGLDYLYACHSDGGDFQNSCSSGVPLDQFGAAPDWDALGRFEGRTQAEGPSYIPLAYDEYTRWTGDHSLATERWPYLRRALMAQVMTPDGRQEFSGDETFRLAMETVLGYPLEFPWHDRAFSANSGFLMAAAADRMATMAAVVEPGDVSLFEDKAQLAREGVDLLWRHDHWATLEIHTGDDNWPAGHVELRSYEDVALRPLWAGSHSAEDPDALSNLADFRAAAGRGDGTAQTDPDLELAGEGFATGMVPGYYLWNLTAIGDPEAEAAFNALYTYASSSGQYAEGIDYGGDFDAFQIIYDALGETGDIVARYRPWEGGINGDAMLKYLVGAEPIAGGVRLEPHLPNDQPWMNADGIRFPDGSGNLSMVRDIGFIGIGFVSTSEVDIEVEIVLPIPEGVSLIATNVDESGFLSMTVSPGGRASASARW